MRQTPVAPGVRRTAWRRLAQRPGAQRPVLWGRPDSRRLFGQGIGCAARLAVFFEDSFQFLRGEDEEFEEARRILEPEEESEDGDSTRVPSEAGQSNG